MTLSEVCPAKRFGRSLDLPDDGVVALGAGVGDAEFQEPFDLGPPRLDRACEPGRLGHVRDDAGGEEPGEPVRGLVPAVAGRAVCSEQLPRQLLAGPRRTDLAGGVVVTQDPSSPWSGPGG